MNTTINILDYQYIVRKIARQYTPHGALTAEDLEQEGMLGLIAAAGHYNPDRGVRFPSYAVWWIRKYIMEALRRYGYIVTRPQHHILEHIFTEQLDRIVSVEDGDVLTYEDVLRATDFTPDEQFIYAEGLAAWQQLKAQQKSQKKRLPVGKFTRMYVNK